MWSEVGLLVRLEIDGRRLSVMSSGVVGGVVNVSVSGGDIVDMIDQGRGH
jgi:hypothetical protein